jgi:transposase
MTPDSPTPDPEVVAKATRRSFSTAEKARILDAYEAASPIERASLCRREGIYVSLIYKWRTKRDAGNVSNKRGPKANPERLEKNQSDKRIAVLEEKLKRAEQVIDIQGKVYALLRACAGESADHLVLPPWQK